METTIELLTKEEVAAYVDVYVRTSMYDAMIKSEKRRLKREQAFQKWKDQLEKRLEQGRRLCANLKSPKTGRKR